MAGLREQIERLLAPIRHKISGIIVKAVLDSLVDTGDFQVCQVVTGKDETQDELERIQQYGFSSVPEKGAEAVVLSVNGNRNQGIIIAIDDHRYRLKGLSSGEVAIYTKQGNHIILKPDGSVQIYSDDIKLGDGSSFKKLVNEGFQTLFNSHVHTIAPTGTPGAPIGVSSSPSKSASATPIRVAPVGAVIHLFNDDLTFNELTIKTKAG